MSQGCHVSGWEGRIITEVEWRLDFVTQIVSERCRVSEPTVCAADIPTLAEGLQDAEPGGEVGDVMSDG